MARVAAPVNPATGSSFDTAVIITAKNEMEGVPAEYRWLKQNMKGYRPEDQSTMAHHGRMYDVIHTRNDAGKESDVYFDITSFSGKL